MSQHRATCARKYWRKVQQHSSRLDDSTSAVQSASRPYSSHLSTLDSSEEILRSSDSRDRSYTLRVVPEMTVNFRLAADALPWALLYAMKTNDVESYKEALVTAVRLNFTIKRPEELLLDFTTYSFYLLADLATAVDRLVRGDIGINNFMEDGQTILHKACAVGAAEMLEPLYWRGACFDALDSDGETPLHDAVRSGDIDTVRYALALGSDPNLNFPLYWAISAEGQDIIMLLLKHGADINQRFGETTVLSTAIESCDSEQVSLALSLGADPNVAHPMNDLIDDCILSGRCDCVHKEMVCLLVEHGADVSKQSRKGRTIFHYAAVQGHAQLLRTALNHINSPTILDMGDDYNDTPLHCAIQAFAGSHAHQALILTSMLLEAGADPNVQNLYGHSALMVAARDGTDDLVRLLLDAGAIVKRECHGKQTALSYAAGRGHSIIVGLLLEKAAPTHEDSLYLTLALEEAVMGSHRDVVKQLLSSGADSSAGPVLVQALTRSSAAVMQILLEAGEQFKAVQDTLLMARMFAARDGVTEARWPTFTEAPTKCELLLRAFPDLRARYYS